MPVADTPYSLEITVRRIDVAVATRDGLKHHGCDLLVSFIDQDLLEVCLATAHGAGLAAIAAGLGIKMAMGDRVVLSRYPLKGPAAQLPPALVGAFAAALGVGGGTLSTPVLSMFSFPIRRAIGAGSLFNLIIAVPATLAFLAMDWQTPGRPADSVGDVAMFCVAALSLPALFVAPVAARWSRRVPVVLLRRSFALCLCAIAVRVALRT